MPGDDGEVLFNDDAKRSISLRIPSMDFGKVRLIARRLRARESEVFRFSLRVALAKLAPLFDEHCRGVKLMPLLIEHGTEFARHFDLDVRRLEAFVNDGVSDPAERVAMEDIELMVMSYMPQRHLYARLQDVTRKKLDPLTMDETLREYLLEKYPQAEAAPQI